MGSKKAPRSVQRGSNCFPEGSPAQIALRPPTWTPHGPQMNPKLGSSWDHLGVILGSSWGHLGVILESSWSHLGMILESSWCYLGVILGSSWGHLGIILGSSWDHLGVILGSSWDHLGITLGSLWHRSGTNVFQQNVADQILAPESRSRAISWGKIHRISSSTRSDWSWASKRGWRQRAKPLG